MSCRYSASHCRTVSLVQFSREASKTCFLLKPTTPTNPNPDRAKPDQDNTDLGVEPQFGFATRFKCFLSLPSAVASTLRVFLDELHEIFEKYENEKSIKIKE